MTRLTDTQSLILSAASQHPNRAVASQPQHGKVLRQLLKRGLLAESLATGDMPIWQRRETDGSIALVVTPAGLAAIGVEPDEDSEMAPAPDLSSDGPGELRGAEIPEALPLSSDNRIPRAGTRLRQVIALLDREGGASTAELMTATGWLAHTTRAALTGLRKRGYGVVAHRDSDGTTYRLTAPSVAGADAVEA